MLSRFYLTLSTSQFLSLCHFATLLTVLVNSEQMHLDIILYVVLSALWLVHVKKTEISYQQREKKNEQKHRPDMSLKSIPFEK